MHESHCGGEIEWILSVAGKRDLGWGMWMRIEGKSLGEDGGREYWDRQLESGGSPVIS